MNPDPLLSIGRVAHRTGCAVSAIRFYADEDLIPSVRNNAGHRLFHRSTIRRISFILILQGLGYRLDEIKAALTGLPEQRTPTKSDWARLSRSIARDVDAKIEQLEKIRSSLDGCIGCGCLSLKACGLYNPQDQISNKGSGARYLLGNSFADID